jgi:hypothetical protein
MTISRHKIGARAEFRKQEGRRIMDSASLSASFPKLKSLRADLSFFTPDGVTRSTRVKYLVNLDHAKSVFRFDCLNRECVHGDFDLSEALAKAVAARKTTAIGEVRCHGWRNKDTIKQVYCRRILRYKLSLGW